ncbi:DNA polymerase IV [Nakamurella antarctica]|uniref:DNA polymerase IV n=1 Tax=Nakamurella antarctica TaxID=1902245 RepID=A0A3G8ZKE1_9ACTN|nr:DNA polymerase IV [Nakamurella antarctica]AZI57658.1 DNA polymerase IV [Nakamurella antarctica]
MGASTGKRRLVTEDLSLVDDSECTILHADMDAFFAAVELRRRPELVGLPMMVASTAGRGVVLSATYEARAHGIRSAMPVATARSMFPQIIIVEPDHRAYSEASARIMEIFSTVTPLVEALSVDEAFLDVGGMRRIAGSPGAIAAKLRSRISSELGLTCTIGVAATKFMAKLGSGLAKPDGLLVIPPASVLSVLHPLGVESLWGVGPKTAQTLRKIGLRTVGDIAQLDKASLVSVVGVAGAEKLHELAWGRDPRSVSERPPESSMSADETFSSDINDRDELVREFLRLSDKLARRVRATGQRAKTIAVRVRFSDFTTVTRSLTLAAPTDLSRDIHAAAVLLFDKLGTGHRTLRLVGVRLEQLVAATEVTQQLAFGDEKSAGWRQAEQVADEVTARFGAGAVRPASLMRPHYPGLRGGPNRRITSVDTQS